MNSVAACTDSLDQTPSVNRKTRSAETPGFMETEDRLIARLRHGDEGAFDGLVNQHHASLIRVALGYVADREVAEEVVQDTWMTVIERLETFEGRSSLRTWIFGILIHKAKDRGVREKRHTTFSALESCDDDHEEAVDPARFQQSGEWAGHWTFPPQPWDDRTPETLLASKQATDCMQRAISDLPSTLREALIMRDVEGIESTEICELLNITETNLYVRLHRARERVRQTVETYLAGGR